MNTFYFQFLNNVPQRISSSKSANRYNEARNSIELKGTVRPCLKVKGQLNDMTSLLIRLFQGLNGKLSYLSSYFIYSNYT